MKKSKVHKQYSWYECIEEPLREIVFRLRNAGINTECSCGHGRYIQCQSLEQYTELNTIYNVLVEMGIKNYRVIVFDFLEDGHRRTHLEISLPDANGQYYWQMADNPDCEFNRKQG